MPAIIYFFVIVFVFIQALKGIPCSCIDRVIFFNNKKPGGNINPPGFN